MIIGVPIIAATAIVESPVLALSQQSAPHSSQTTIRDGTYDGPASQRITATITGWPVTAAPATPRPRPR